MTLTLAQTQAIGELAHAFYPFLPGKPHPFANHAISFEGVARGLGIPHCWPGGSKAPAISVLLTNTLEQEPQTFTALIVEVVKNSILYRQNKNPITRQEIQGVNELLFKLGFKIPELHDGRFLQSLPNQGSAVQEQADGEPSNSALGNLRSEHIRIGSLGAQERGYAFEKLLSEMFKEFNLAPLTAFRLVGEQIDGSLEFQGETYLLEAKWQGKPIGQEELLAFLGKVKGNVPLQPCTICPSIVVQGLTYRVIPGTPR